MAAARKRDMFIMLLVAIAVLILWRAATVLGWTATLSWALFVVGAGLFVVWLFASIARRGRQAA